ncbi:MAG: dihydrolipoyl dehydrogenase [Planctomycetes bacterium]|nr:dihydrolipoyl dehydrogenase [Planctomycetota bacterium]
MMETFDVVVIGAGPAGYVAAIRASQLGLRTACVDEWIGKDGESTLGGTCLNAGCIPSKALLDSSEHYYRLVHNIGAHGIKADNVRFDVKAMLERKDEIVRRLTRGVEGLFRKNNVTWFRGRGKLREGLKVEVEPRHEKHQKALLEARNIIIATGSVPRSLPMSPMDGRMIVDSSGALEFDEVPRRLGIVGAGVIGVELGSVWNRLGSDVVLLEATDEFLFFVDEEISKVALEEFSRQGLKIRLSARVLSAEARDGEVHVRYEDGDGKHDLAFDRLVVSVGRRPNTDGLDAEAVDLYIDESGFIKVDEGCRTSLPGIYAVGDVVRGPMVAHRGSEEGVMVAERIAGQKTTVNYGAIPWVIYTWPEIAWAGMTEKELREAGREYRAGRFPMRANGRAMAMEENTGLVKLLADAKTDELLGIHMFGPFASELIAEAVVALEYKASAEDIARTVHAHPTISEALHEAALAVDGRSLHM